MGAPGLPPLGRSASWVVGCRVVGIAATVAGNILAARLLGPAEFGLFLIATTGMAAGSLLAMGGLNEAGLRFVAEQLGHQAPRAARGFAILAMKSALKITLFVALALAAGMFFASWVTPQWQLSAWLVALIVAGVALLAWQQLAAELTRGFGELPIASLFSGGQTGGPLSNLLFVALLALCWIANLHLGATAAIALLVVTVLVTCPLALAGLWRTMHAADERTGEISAIQRQALLTTGLLLLANQVLALVSQQSDLWIAGASLPADDVGLFGAAKRVLLLVAMPVQMATLTIVGSIPRLHAQHRTSELESLIRSAATAAAVPALVAIGLMFVFPGALLGTVFGPAYTGAGATLLALLVGHLVLIISGNPQHVLIMTGRHRVVLLVNLIAALVLVGAGIFGAATWGPIGLAAASSAALSLQNGALWWIAHRELHVWTHIGWPASLLAGNAQSEASAEPASTTV